MRAKTEWWGAGMVICLERGADLHMAQLIPLPLTVSCFCKIQTDFTFLVLAYPVVQEKGPVNGCMYVCICRMLYMCNENIHHVTVLKKNIHVCNF